MEYIDAILKRVQELSRDILNIVNPVRYYELPIIVFTLKAILANFEKAMSEEQKILMSVLQSSIGSELRISGMQMYKFSNGSVTEIEEEDGK